MRKKFSAIICFILSLSASSQVNFEKGFLIDNNQQRIDCFIKNIDWEQDSKVITYKLTPDGPIKTAGIESIKEFRFINNSRFIRVTANIDKSSNQTGRLDTNRNPSFNEETFFVKVLVEGDAELYYYSDDGIRRFFYRVGDSGTEQLVYKKYLTSNNKIGLNEGYKQQLLNNLKCSEIDMTDIQNLKYDQKKLVNLFIDYNKCMNASYTDLTERDEPGEFNLMIKAGVNTSELEMVQRMSYRETEFDRNLSFRIGMEMEYLFPFANKKWALTFNPSLYRYTATQEGRLSVGEYLPFILGYRSIQGEFEIASTGIELPLGVKHYFYLNESFRMFLNGAYVIDYISDSSEFIPYEDEDVDESITKFKLEPTTGKAFSIGIGGDYNRKFTLELKYYFNKVMLDNLDWKVTQKNLITVNLGYFIL